jgi:hypothetical protein
MVKMTYFLKGCIVYVYSVLEDFMSGSSTAARKFLTKYLHRKSSYILQEFLSFYILELQVEPVLCRV